MRWRKQRPSASKLCHNNYGHVGIHTALDGPDPDCALNNARVIVDYVACCSLTNTIAIEQSPERTDQAVAIDGFSAAFRSSTTANIGRYMNSTIHRPTSV